MILIAHRGLIDGPNKNLENHPLQILKSIQLGFDCEIDIHVVNNELYLGHDGPQYKIDHEFITKKGLWIHCKNFEALTYCKNYSELNYFWHQTDNYTLTSKNWFWVYPGNPTNSSSIQVMPEMIDSSLNNLDFQAGGICSDWTLNIQKKYKEHIKMLLLKIR